MQPVEETPQLGLLAGVELALRRLATQPAELLGRAGDLDLVATHRAFRTIHRLLEQAARRGEIRDDVPVDLLCVHVHNALESAMRARAEGRADDTTARADLLVDLALDGIRTASDRA